MKTNRIRLVLSMAFVLTCGYLITGCLSSYSVGGSDLPKPTQAGTAVNEVPAK